MLARSCLKTVAAYVCATWIGSASLAAQTTEQEKLTASDAAGGDTFGHTVAIDGNTAVIGAYFDDDLGFASGSAYVFFRTGTDWAEQSKLTASDGTSADRFGWDVSVSGDTAVVSAIFGDGLASVSGTAYVYVRSGTSWSEQAKLVAPDGAMSDWFGRSVSITDDTIVVGAPQDDDLGLDSGSIYVFVRAGTVWTLQEKKLASDGAIDDNFGQAVSISGDTIVVGAPEDDDGGGQSGSGYVFTRVGTSWSEQEKLVASDASSNDWFGFSAAIEGDTAVMGAYRDDDAGSESGSAYVFTRVGTSWSQTSKLIAGDGSAGDQFGWFVAVDGTRAVAGARRNGHAGTDSGAAYLFESDGATWSEQSKLVASDAASGDELGISVAVDADTVLVGAYKDDHVGSNAGSAYSYTFAGPGASYCIATPNSTGDFAHTSAEGSVSIAADSFSLFAEPVPANQNGVFYYGPEQAQLPFGNGFQCVAPGATGFARLPVVQADAFEVMTHQVDFSAPPTAMTQITAGSTWNFQAWFRDPLAGGAFFNLSDGLEVTFEL